MLNTFSCRSPPFLSVGVCHNDAIDDVLIILHSKIENLLDEIEKEYINEGEIKPIISEIEEVKRIVKKLRKRYI